jgi:hypothetical protein
MIMMPYGRPKSSLQLTGQAEFWHPTRSLGAMPTWPKARRSR